MEAKHVRDTFQVRNRRTVIVIYEWVSAIIVALIALVLLLTYLIRVVGVDGDSMYPTLKDGDRLLLSRVETDYQRGDIVVVDRYTEAPLIKRVIALPGDVVRIDKNYLYIDDQLQDEPYTVGYTVPRDFVESQTVPEGYVFVLGDNRSVSVDSRVSEVGMVSVKDIVGKAVCCIWPPDSIGGIYDNLP